MNLLKLIGGLLILIISILLFIYLYKHPIPKGEDTNLHMFQGYIAVIGGFIIGLILIIEEIKTIF